MTRVFDAPRALVFKVWTDPRRIAQWWGPNGFTTTMHGDPVRGVPDSARVPTTVTGGLKRKIRRRAAASLSLTWECMRVPQHQTPCELRSARHR